MIYTLPKPYLSYSAISLFYKNKQQFRDRYYLNKKTPDTAWTLFGKEIHKALEKNEEKLSHIPRYLVSELEVRTEIGGVPILAYIDSFEPEEKRILDFKTSMKQWTQKEVDTLMQLPFYSELIFREYGSVHPQTKIVWLETQLVPSTGLLSQGDSIQLTGRHEVFEREITQAERDHVVAWVIQAAEEISEDYSIWKKENESDK